MIAMVAALAVAVSWWLHAGAPRAAPGRAPAPAVAPAAGTAARPQLRVPGVTAPGVTAPPQARSAAAGPPVLTDEIRRQLAESIQQLRHAARGCLAEHTPRPRAPGVPDESLDRIGLRLTIAVEGGEAAVAAVEKIADGFGDVALEGCVLDAVRAARWQTAHPDGSLGLEHALYVGDLLDHDPLAPPLPGAGRR